MQDHDLPARGVDRFSRTCPSHLLYMDSGDRTIDRLHRVTFFIHSCLDDLAVDTIADRRRLDRETDSPTGGECEIRGV